MEISNFTNPAPTARHSSAGAVFAMLLILGLIIGGAYYAFTDRFAAIHGEMVTL